MKNIQNKTEIRTHTVSQCYLCKSKGNVLHANIQDRLFGTIGKWSLSKCSNQSCQLIWLNPMPLEEDIGIAYQSYYTHSETQTKQNSKAREFYEFIQRCYLSNKYGYFKDKISGWQKKLGLFLYIDIVRKANTDFKVMKIPALLGGTLLDVGCGNGEFLHTMKQLGWNVQGLDVDEKAAETARRNNINVRIGTLDKSGFSSNMFDAIVLSHVIEHVYDPISLLRECKRILKPGGKIFILTPNSKSLCHKLFGEYWRGLEVPRHLMVFSNINLESCANVAGFKTVEISCTERSAKSIYCLSRMIKSANKISEKNINSRSIGYSIQLWEKIVQKFGFDCGEEIYFVGSKE
jgi:2-polyprenyl-3-methyl-5-hydroxy-6-metoxy-1,4-benzoquinol methylase